jgi:hypothetical protein
LWKSVQPPRWTQVWLQLRATSLITFFCVSAGVTRLGDFWPMYWEFIFFGSFFLTNYRSNQMFRLLFST